MDKIERRLDGRIIKLKERLRLCEELCRLTKKEALAK